MKYYKHVFITEDGSIFKSEDEAFNHELICIARSKLKAYTNRLSHRGIILPEQVELLAEVMESSKYELIEILEDLI